MQLAKWQRAFIRSLFHYSAARLDIERAFLIKHENVPSKLYKYRQFNDLSWQSLIADELWMSAPEKFNDPFDSVVYFDPGRFKMDDVSGEEMIARAKALQDFDISSTDRSQFKIENPIASKDWLKSQIDVHLASVDSEIRDKVWAFVDEAQRAHNEAAIRRMSSNMRRGFSVLSLSANPTSNLMWSHYADSHKGFCIEYDFASLAYGDLRRRLCFPIFYRQKRTDATRYLARGVLNDFNNLFGQYTCLLKSSEWAYEREWRIIFAIGPTQANRPLIMPQPSALIVGANANDEDLAKALEFCNLRSIPLKKAQQSYSSLRIELTDQST